MRVAPSTHLPSIDVLAFDRGVRPADDSVGRVLAAAGWPGRPPQSRLIPPALAAVAAVSIGPRAGAWQLGSWLMAPIGSGIKAAIGRRRPPTAALPFLGSRGKGSSFPSTHVATYTTFYGFLAWLLVRRGQLALATIPIGLVALVGPSRVRSGDHWATDVLAGYALGATGLAIAVATASKDRGLDAELLGQPDRGDEAPPPPSAARENRARENAAPQPAAGHASAIPVG